MTNIYERALWKGRKYWGIYRQKISIGLIISLLFFTITQIQRYDDIKSRQKVFEIEESFRDALSRLIRYGGSFIRLRGNLWKVHFDRSLSFYLHFTFSVNVIHVEAYSEIKTSCVHNHLVNDSQLV